MFLKFIKFQELLAPEDKIIGGTSDKSVDDIVALLNEDDESDVDDVKDDKKEEKLIEPEDDEEETEDNDEDEEDELKEIEEDLEDPDEEKLELVAAVPRREILKKYPNIFKDFPALQNSYYREREFTNLFPTIDEAKEAAEKSVALDKFESDLKDGNLEVALQVIKNESPKNFAKVVDNYLDTLAKVDKDSVLHIYGNVIRKTIIEMVKASDDKDDDVLKNAAHILNQWVFGTKNFTAPTKLSSDEPEKKDEEKSKFEEERQAFLQEKFDTVQGELNTRVTNHIKSLIDTNIDPKNSMGPYVKKAASAEAYNELMKLIGEDKRFQDLKDRLWDRAIKSKFSSEDKEKIRQAITSKAKTVLPSVIKKARIEALKGIGKRVREDDSKESGNGEKNKSERRSAPNNERKSNAIGKPKPGETALEFLMRD